MLEVTTKIWLSTSPKTRRMRTYGISPGALTCCLMRTDLVEHPAAWLTRATLRGLSFARPGDPRARHFPLFFQKVSLFQVPSPQPSHIPCVTCVYTNGVWLCATRRIYGDVLYRNAFWLVFDQNERTKRSLHPDGSIRKTSCMRNSRSKNTQNMFIIYFKLFPCFRIRMVCACFRSPRDVSQTEAKKHYLWDIDIHALQMIQERVVHVVRVVAGFVGRRPMLTESSGVANFLRLRAS